MSVRSVLLATAVAALAVCSVGPSSTAAGSTWQQVAQGGTGGISGMAPAATGWVVVRDNKLAGQNRIALLSPAGVVTALSWPGAQPQDLEAVAAVPGQPGTFATLASSGIGYLVSLDGGHVSVVRGFTVPQGTSNIESFALTQVGTATIAVWATRGSTTAAAKVFVATFTPSSGTFGTVTTGKVTVPYPTANVRQVSDLTVAAGRLVAASSSDPGNSGPFTGALYDIGSVTFSGGRARLALSTPNQLGTYEHKVEGVACSGTTGLLGSDDEKLGGWTTPAAFCG